MDEVAVAAGESVAKDQIRIACHAEAVAGRQVPDGRGAHHASRIGQRSGFEATSRVRALVVGQARCGGLPPRRWFETSWRHGARSGPDSAGPLGGLGAVSAQFRCGVARIWDVVGLGRFWAYPDKGSWVRIPFAGWCKCARDGGLWRPPEASWDRSSMRGRTLLVGGALVAGAGAVAATGRGRRWRPKHVTGAFPSGFAYARFGTGPKTLLWLAHSDGPPGGLDLAVMWPTLRPFVEDGYSVWIVSNLLDMPIGHTLADLADDYARLIAEDFDGTVDLVIGHSTGGMIGFYLAACHPDRFRHIAIAGAACEWSEGAQTANVESARLLVAGRKRDAAAVLISYNLPDMPSPLVKVVAAGMARVYFSGPINAGDVLAHAEALDSFEGREILPKIEVPVLLVGGDKDGWFPRESLEETARLIPDCTFKLYRGKNHIQTIFNSEFPKDVLQFARG